MAQIVYPRDKEIIISDKETVETLDKVITNAVQTAAVINAAGQETTIDCYSGNIIGSGGLTMIAETTFTAKSGYCYKPTPTITMHNLVQGGYDYSNHYSTKVVPIYTNNRITSFKAQIFYDPPKDKFLFPDPNLFSSFDHLAFVDYELKTTETAIENAITHVSYSPELSRFNQETYICVYGTVGAKYNLRIRNFSWFQNDWASSGLYDFVQGTFTTPSGDSTSTGTIGADGKNIHFIKIPNHKTIGSGTYDVNKGNRYDIILDGIGETTIQPKAPTVDGDASIIQYGIENLNIETASYTGNLQGKEAAIQLPRVIPSIKSPRDHAKPIFIKAGNSDTSGTKVTVDIERLDVKEGMRMFNVGDTAGNTIKVSKIQGKKITTSSAIAVPDDTQIRLEEDKDLIDITMTIYPTGAARGKTVFLTRQPTVDDIGGFKDIAVLTDGAVNASTTVVLDSTAGIVPGMTVTGEGIPDNKTIYVSSITNATTLVVDSAVELADNTRLKFTGVNNKVEVLDTQARIFDGGVSVKVTLKVREINRVYIGDTLQDYAIGLLYVDNFITTN